MRGWRLNVVRLLLSVVLVVPLSGSAQEQFGAAFSNYTPTNSVFLNPSSMLDAKTWLDIHIVGAGSYTNNNFIYLRDANYAHIISTEGREMANEDGDPDIGYNQNHRKYHAYNCTFAQVLSAVWSQGDHAAGLFFNARSITAARGVPDFATRFIQYGVPGYTQQHDIDYSIEKLRAASINFGQLQLSYAYTFRKRRREMYMGGVSVKKFFSVMGGAANLYNADFNVRSDQVMSVFSLAADGMYTPNPQFYSKGGYGLDLGFTYQKMMSEATSYYPNMKKMGCRYVPYKYWIGVSLLDIGSVKFDPDTVQFAGYDFESFEWNNYSDAEVNEDNVVDFFAAQESDIDEGRVRKKDRIRLPTCLSIQGDYHLWASRLYANASIVHGLPVGGRQFGVRRANTLMVGLRYESRLLDVSLPLSLYEYITPQVGLALRFYCLTIGTDKLFHIIGYNDLYGADIYFHLKIPIFYNPKCREAGKASNKLKPWKKRSITNCDAYQ